MEDFTLYLLKVSASIAAFYSLYYLLFRKEKQFVFNRVYLSSTLIISFLIPLITFKTEVPIVQSINSFSIDSISESNLNDIKYANQSIEITRFDLWTIIKMAYLFACFFLFLRLIFGIYKVKHIIKKGKPHTFSDQEVIVTEKDICPFSFFNKIVIPVDLIKSEDLPMIIMHEKIHIKEKHFIDLHLSEFFLLFLWFNPFSWFVNSAIRTNLEFSADDAVKNELYDLEEYQMAMVRLINSKHISPLANALNVSQLKNRIMMMKRKRQNKYPVLKRLATLPLLFLMVFVLSAKEEIIIPIQGNIVRKTVTSEKIETPIIIKSENDVTHKAQHVFNASERKNREDIKLERKKPLTGLLASEQSIAISNLIQNVKSKNQFVITGKIYGGFNGMTPVPWVNVSVKGETNSVIADEEGNYSITTNKNDKTLQFSSFGYRSKEVEINGQQELDVKLNGIICIFPNIAKNLERHMYDQLKNINNGRTVEGKVISKETDMPLEGVQVFIKGKPLGTLTDFEGKFKINVEKGDKVLLIDQLRYDSDMVWYQSKEVQIGNNTRINVELEKSDKQPAKKHQKMINGRVYSSRNNEPIPGAFVMLSDRQAGAVTSEDGNYSIGVYDNDESFLIKSEGYVDKEVQLNSKENIDIYLDPVSSVEKIKVTGKVTELNANTPIPGVAVVVKGTTIGAITDKEGNYTISFPEENNVLVFALMGYKLKEVEINNKERIDVSMEKEESPGVIINQLPEDMPELGEIVLKGKVTESDSEKALGGISVIIKGKPTGTMTDKDGNYQIHVSKDDDKLVFISPDYQTQEIEISEIKEIDVKLVKK